MEIFKFLSWQWRKWHTWQKIFIVAMIFQIVSIALPSSIGMFIWSAGFGVTLFFMLKWFIYDTLKDSFTKYKEDRNKLFGVIKDSDN